MDYTLDTSTITTLVKQEVSRIAAAAYDEQGQSLYDSIVILSRDSSIVDRLIGDTVRSLVSRLSQRVTVTDSGLSFNVPDMDTTKADYCRSEVTRFISLEVSGLWLDQKYPQASGQFHTGAAEALKKIVRILLTRVAPTR